MYRFSARGGWPSARLTESLFHFEHHHGLIVKDFSPGGECVCCLKDCVHNLPCGAAGILRDNVLHAAAAKRFVFRVAGINDAITKEREYITRLGGDRDFV